MQIVKMSQHLVVHKAIAQTTLFVKVTKLSVTPAVKLRSAKATIVT